MVLRLWSGVSLVQDWEEDGTVHPAHLPPEWVELFTDLVFAAMASRMGAFVEERGMSWPVLGSIALYYALLYKVWEGWNRNHSRFKMRDLFWLLAWLLHCCGFVGMVWNLTYDIVDRHRSFVLCYFVARGAQLLVELKIILYLDRARALKARSIFAKLVAAVFVGCSILSRTRHTICALWAAAAGFEYLVVMLKFLAAARGALPWLSADLRQNTVPLNVEHWNARMQRVTMTLLGTAVARIAVTTPADAPVDDVVSAFASLVVFCALAAQFSNMQPGQCPTCVHAMRVSIARAALFAHVHALLSFAVLLLSVGVRLLLVPRSTLDPATVWVVTAGFSLSCLLMHAGRRLHRWPETWAAWDCGTAWAVRGACVAAPPVCNAFRSHLSRAGLAAIVAGCALAMLLADSVVLRAAARRATAAWLVDRHAQAASAGVLGLSGDRLADNDRESITSAL